MHLCNIFTVAVFLVCVLKVLVAELCPTLCNPMDYSLPGSSVHGTSQARIWERVAISFFRVSSFAAAAAAKLLQSCPTLCDTIDSSPPGSPVPGIL